MDSVDPRGKTHLSKAFISKGNDRELSACFISVCLILAKNHLSKSNLEIFAL